MEERLMLALLAMFPRAQVPGLVLLCCRLIGHEPEVAHEEAP